MRAARVAVLISNSDNEIGKIRQELGRDGGEQKERDQYSIIKFFGPQICDISSLGLDNITLGLRASERAKHIGSFEQFTPSIF